MKRTPFIIIAAVLTGLSLSACSGGIGLGSLLGPEVAAKPTEQDRQKLGEAGQRLDELKKRADAVVNDVSKAPLKGPEVTHLGVLEDDADHKLSVWGRDPRDTTERLQAMEAITNFERLIISLETR